MCKITCLCDVLCLHSACVCHCTTHTYSILYSIYISTVYIYKRSGRDYRSVQLSSKSLIFFLALVLFLLSSIFSLWQTLWIFPLLIPVTRGLALALFMNTGVMWNRKGGGEKREREEEDEEQKWFARFDSEIWKVNEMEKKSGRRENRWRRNRWGCWGNTL